jgi:capsular polysaccharide biosynthesis protein
MLSRTVGTAVRHEAHVVYLIVALFVTLAGIAAVLQPRLYGANGSVLVTPATFLDPASTDALPELSDTIVAVATSPAVLRGTAAAYTQAAANPAAAAARREQATVDWLRRHVAVSPAGTSSLLQVSARAPHADDARDLADAEMRSLQHFVRDARPLSAAGAAGDPPGIRLVVVSAGRAMGLVSPKPVRNSLVGLALGVIVGCVVALLLSRRRRREYPRRLAEELGASWLGTVHLGAAGRAVHTFFEGVAASERLPGQVALVTGTASAATIARTARDAVLVLNERARRALLVDGELGVRAIGRQLERARQPEVVNAPAGDWASLPAPSRPAELVAPLDGAKPETRSRSAALVRPGGASGALWPEYEFVVLSGPSAGRSDELLPIMGALHSVVLLIEPGARPSDVDALRVLAREAAAVRAAVTVIGVMDTDAQASSSS